MEETDGRSLNSIIKDYQNKRRISIDAAENYLYSHHRITDVVRSSLQNQLKEISPGIFQWLYDCASSKKDSSKLFIFTLQFVPDLIYLYLYCIAENKRQLKAPVEALLLGIIKEVESDKEIPLQVPTPSHPSIYHQIPLSISQPSLTETALSHHNQLDIDHSSPTFTNKEINTANRSSFITSVITACTNHMTIYNLESQTAFCQICTRLALTGMTSRCLNELTEYSTQAGCVTMDQLSLWSKDKRFNVTDEFISSLLHGIRMCLSQPCHFAAKQALHALKLRAEYELLPLALQISLTLERFFNEIHPLRLPFDHEIHKTYSTRDATHWPSRPITVLRTLTGQILHHHLNPLSFPDNPHDISDERMSIDADDLFLSQSYAEYRNQPSEQDEFFTKHEEVSFRLHRDEISDTESEDSIVDETINTKERLVQSENMISPSDIKVEEHPPPSTQGEITPTSSPAIIELVTPDSPTSVRTAFFKSTKV